MVLHSCNFSTKKANVGGSETQGQHRLHKENRSMKTSNNKIMYSLSEVAEKYKQYQKMSEELCEEAITFKDEWEHSIRERSKHNKLEPQCWGSKLRCSPLGCVVICWHDLGQSLSVTNHHQLICQQHGSSPKETYCQHACKTSWWSWSHREQKSSPMLCFTKSIYCSLLTKPNTTQIAKEK